MNNEKPYIKRRVSKTIYVYNPDYGDDRVCKCGHSYMRHFDTYSNMDGNTMDPVGCKYCDCFRFQEENNKNQCPCGGYMNDWHSHDSDCIVINNKGKDFSKM